MEKKNDLRVQKTYRALMAAFEALMAEETFDDITVNELCARAHSSLTVMSSNVSSAISASNAAMSAR